MNKGYYITSEGERVEFDDAEMLNFTTRNIVKFNLDFIKCLNLNKNIIKIDLSNCIKLKELYCYDTQLNQLDLSNNINLKYLYCDIKTKVLNYNNKTTINFM